MWRVNKKSIPFALIGYVFSQDQFGATRLVVLLMYSDSNVCSHFYVRFLEGYGETADLVIGNLYCPDQFFVDL